MLKWGSTKPLLANAVAGYGKMGFTFHLYILMFQDVSNPNLQNHLDAKTGPFPCCKKMPSSKRTQVAAGSLARLLKMELQKRSSRFTTLGTQYDSMTQFSINLLRFADLCMLALQYFTTWNTRNACVFG